MIITGKRQLLQLKKMAISYLLFCQQEEKKPFLLPEGHKSLFFAMQNEDTEKLIAEIDRELSTIQ